MNELTQLGFVKRLHSRSLEERLGRCEEILQETFDLVFFDDGQLTKLPASFTLAS